jgi:hypothetical protein
LEAVYVRSEISTAVTMKNAVFRDVALWSLSVYGHLLALVPHSRIFSTLKKEAIRFSKTSVHAASPQRHIPEDGILWK